MICALVSRNDVLLYLCMDELTHVAIANSAPLTFKIKWYVQPHAMKNALIKLNLNLINLNLSFRHSNDVVLNLQVGSTFFMQIICKFYEFTILLLNLMKVILNATNIGMSITNLTIHS